MITQMVRNSDGGSSNLNGGGLDGNSGCGHNMVGNGLGNMLGDSPGLVQGLVDNGLGLNNRFLGKDGLVFNDGLGDMFGGDDLAGGDMGNGCGFMDHSGFSDGVGDGGKLGGHLGIGMGLGDSVGKVATQPVGLNGGGVVGGGGISEPISRQLRQREVVSPRSHAESSGPLSCTRTGSQVNPWFRGL